MTVPSSQPAVSVVVPAHNAVMSIDRALESAFAQTYRDFEIIVVDDGSTDGTRQRLAAWGRCVSVLSQPNRGPASARNAAIAVARGRLIAFLDADDEWLPDKLASQVEYFARYPQTGLLHTAVSRRAFVPPAVTRPDRASGPVPPRRMFCELFHTDLDVNTLTVVVPRDVLSEVGLFDEDRAVHVEDWELWLRIAARYPVGFLPWATAIREAGGGMSRAYERTFAGQELVIRRVMPTCELACARHADQATACFARRWHRLRWEQGYARLRAGDCHGARTAFAAALAYRPSHLGTYRQLAATCIGGRGRRFLRFVRSGVQSPRRPPSLVQNTVCRRARHFVAERVHDLDDVLAGSRQTRRVLFQAASPMSFVVFRPVYERLRHDTRIEFWFTAVGTAWKPRVLFERFGIRDRVVPPAQARWMKVDACVNADFWDTTWLRRRTRRLHLFHGVAGKYGLDAPVDLAPIVAAYDRLLFPNRDRLARYVEAGLVSADGATAVLAGYPKVDALVDGSLDERAIRESLRLDARRPTVMYAPTWSPYSSLNSFGERIIDELAAAGFHVLVKLHDRSYDRSPRGSGGIDWASRLGGYRDHPLVRVLDDPDSTPYYLAADAMVTDHSSVGFEYTLLDRPLVIVDCPELVEHARVTRARVLELRNAAELARSPADVVTAVSRQLETPCLHEFERRALAARYFYQPGRATARVASVVYEVLELDEPATRPAVTSAAPRDTTARLI
jgi:hypothetical protein